MNKEFCSVTATGTENFIIAAPNEKPKATPEEEQAPILHQLHPGDVVIFGVGNMDGERPKPGERCLLHKSFECRRIIDGYDIDISTIQRAHYGKPPSKWARLCLWMIYGPRRWRKPMYYEVIYRGDRGRIRKRCLSANGRSDLRACHFCGNTGSLSVAYSPYIDNLEYKAGIKCFNCGLTFEPPYTYDTPEEAVDEAVKAWNADSKRPNYVVKPEREDA